MNLNLLSPIYLLGLLGISLPVLVHMLTRRQQTHIKFSAVYLLTQAQKRAVKRRRPNRLLLLLCRCMGIAFLSFALANPLFSFGGSQEFLTNVPGSNIFILDDSYSMRHSAAEKNLYESAVEVLDAMIEKFPPRSSFSLVLASDPPKVVQDWTTEKSGIKKFLKSSTPSYKTTSISRAVSQSFELLESAPHKSKRIFILTDRDKNGWTETEIQPPSNPHDVKIKVIDFSEMKKGVNQAFIHDLEVTQEFLTNSKIIRVKVGVTSLLPDRPIKRLPVSLWVNGKLEKESSVDLPPGGKVEKEFSFPYLGNDPIKGHIEIQDDALAIDNRRVFTYQPDQKIKVLIVDGDPRAIAHQSEAFYLERALNPFSVSLSDIVPTLSTVAELPRRNLALFSVIMLCNVQELPFDFERDIEKFVMQGGALFISLGDQVDAKFYNEKMGSLLPVTLKTLNQVSDNNNPFQLLSEPSDHPVMKIFSGKTLKEMGAISFNSIYSVEPRENAKFSIPMKFVNGFPAITESEFGKGKVILFTSSVDRDWNNFPIQPTFLPWIQRWVKYSARSLENITQKSFLVGEPFILENGEDIRYLKTPQGTLKRLARDQEGKIRFADTFRPGIYALFRDHDSSPSSEKLDDKTAVRPLDKLPVNAERAGSFTINLDTRESSAGLISDQEIQTFFAGFPLEITNDLENWKSSEEITGFSLTTPLLMLVALMLFTEGWMVRRE